MNYCDILLLLQFKQEIVLIDVNDNDPEFDPELPATVTVNEVQNWFLLLTDFP